ncbi:protein kinase domain-containing protein [Novipirellula sp. SH528]|uniref:protein kinase domain-containing protein n=1 Tax=Novipirellula sp. SH528 TaxID=3454466 RepID=UPI003FA1773D
MQTFTTCLQADELKSFIAGDLSEQRVTEVEEHLSICDTCREALENTAGDREWWSDVEHALGVDPSSAFSDSVHDEQQGFGYDRLIELLGPTDDPSMMGRIGSYEIVGILGRGGMGAVFKAFDAGLHRYVAIKVLLPHLASSGAARARFRREGQAAAAVIDDHVLPIYAVDQWQGTPYLVMQYMRGVSLQKRLHDQGPLELREILRIGLHAARGLAAAHAQGLVHRDVKPSNILLDSTVERSMLTDFGLARAVDDASLTASGILAGTPQYMSPEQARADAVDARSDLFSLGSVLYAMCTGHAPFRAENSIAVLRLIADKQPRPIREVNPDIPEWLCAIISKLMSKQASDRFDSAEQVAELLEDCLAHVQQPTTTPLPESVAKLSKSFEVRGNDKPAESLGDIRRPPIGRFIAAAAFAFSLIFAGVLIVLELNKGTLKIESEADDVPIRIMQGDNVVKRLTVTKSRQNVRIAAGNYVIEVDGRFDVMVVDGGNVSLQRGGTDVVKIVMSAKPLKLSESTEAIKLNKPPQDDALAFVGFRAYWQHLTGIRVGSNDAAYIQNNSNLRGGLWIGEVDAGSPAAMAGLKSRDTLVGLGPWEILSQSDLRFVESQLRTGKLETTNLKVHIFRLGEGVLFGHITVDAKKIADIGKLVLSSKFRPGDLNDLRFGKRDERGPFSSPSRVGQTFAPEDTIDDFSNFPALGNGIEEVGMIIGVVPPQTGSEPPFAELYLVQASGVREIENNPTRFTRNIQPGPFQPGPFQPVPFQPAPFQPVPGKQSVRVGYYALTFATEKKPSVTLEMMEGSAHVYVMDVVGLANEQGRKSLNIPQEDDDGEPWLPVSFPMHQQSKWAARLMNLDGWEKKSGLIYTHVVDHEFNLKPGEIRTVSIVGPGEVAARPHDDQSGTRTIDYRGQCVRAEDGVPIAGAIARFFIRGNKRLPMRLFDLTTTDKDGHFRFDSDIPSDGEVDLARSRIAITSPGRASRLFFWQDGADLRQIEMRPAASLNGRVTDSASRPVVGANVRLGPNRMSGVNDAVTDQDGRYEIEDLEKVDNFSYETGISNMLYVEHFDGRKSSAVIQSIPSTVEIVLTSAMGDPGEGTEAGNTNPSGLSDFTGLANEDEVVWSKPVQGLRLGVRFEDSKRGQTQRFTPGDVGQLQIYLQNASDEAIRTGFEPADACQAVFQISSQDGSVIAQNSGEYSEQHLVPAPLSANYRGLNAGEIRLLNDDNAGTITRSPACQFQLGDIAKFTVVDHQQSNHSSPRQYLLTPGKYYVSVMLKAYSGQNRFSITSNRLPFEVVEVDTRSESN